MTRSFGGPPRVDGLATGRRYANGERPVPHCRPATGGMRRGGPVVAVSGRKALRQGAGCWAGARGRL
ncbi:hypothetical protein [Streptomyces huiliensis]|uniref:hypothetical protein n=1 Tax=Streptomyces huiliensis TaxID=2876027 RepID=UPI001CBF104E|nr:hypothetical protein [Streptomyces huiliensis]MBZ4321234.1 hypothetical protein [Streptomyces huiliensis]